MSVRCRLITESERVSLEKRSIAAGAFRYGLMEPGMMWFCPWVHDPNDARDMAERAVALENPRRDTMLSMHYWRTWGAKRPPLMVVCPNGRLWCVDQRSRGGDGWRVRGDPPDLVVEPSIVVPGYHGWLGTSGAAPGWFTADIEGRGPVGAPE